LDESSEKAHDLAAPPESPKLLDRSSEQYVLLWEDREDTDPSEEGEIATSETQTGPISALRLKDLNHPVMPENARYAICATANMIETDTVSPLDQPQRRFSVMS
jgi:hypothetical protein